MLSSSQLDRFLEALTGAPALIQLLAFFLTWGLLWVPLAIPLGMDLQWNPLQQAATPSQKLPLVASLYALAPVMVWGESILEKVALKDYGLSFNLAALQSLGYGFGLGIAGLAILFIGQWQLEWIKLQPVVLPVLRTESSSATELEPALSQQTPKLSKLVLTLIALLGVTLWISFTEELVFRGLLLNQLQRDYATWAAVTIASLIFALLHLVWEGRENIPQLPGLWLMGVVLCLARWADQGNLGLAIGLHTGWIWTIASLDTTQLISYTGKAPAWLTGLGNKPLAGLMGLLFLLAMAGLLAAIG